VARALHRLSPRRDRRFCDVNCAALPDDLLESELFGHTKGAFTGAVADRAGLIEEADGGTLFLDEVADLSPRAQAKLLRVLQQQEVRRVGATVSRKVDIRVVSAANRDMRVAVAEGRFRQDLLYRLDVIRIRMPPLRAAARGHSRPGGSSVASGSRTCGIAGGPDPRRPRHAGSLSLARQRARIAKCDGRCGVRGTAALSGEPRRPPADCHRGTVGVDDAAR